MKKPNRFLIYILIIIVLFFLVEENDVERDQLHEWILPLIVVVVAGLACVCVSDASGSL